jgi:hypothetical protein
MGTRARSGHPDRAKRKRATRDQREAICPDREEKNRFPQLLRLNFKMTG